MFKRVLIAVIVVMWCVGVANSQDQNANVGKKGTDGQSIECNVYDELKSITRFMEELIAQNNLIYNKLACGDDTQPFWYKNDGKKLVIDGKVYEVTNNIVDNGGRKYKVVYEIPGNDNTDYGKPDGYGSVTADTVVNNTGSLVVYEVILYFVECRYD